VASQSYFPTPELPAFLLTWDLRGLVEALRGAEDIAVEPAGEPTANSARAVEMLRLMLLKRAPLDSSRTCPRSIGKDISIYVGTPQELSGNVSRKAKAVLAACRASGLPEDRGYILPFGGGIWVGGADSVACERALGLMLQVARLASFGRESVPYRRVEDLSDGIPYP